MEERYLEQALKDSVKELVKANIEAEIDNKVEEFRRQLEYRKDQYIAEVMKGIRIFHESMMPKENKINYIVTFENIYSIKSED